MEDPVEKMFHDLELYDLRKELNELKEEKVNREKAKKEEITLAQQMLLMYYLGLLNQIDISNKAKSFFLSKILNRSMDNIRKILTSINSPRISDSKIKNEENLEVVLKIFQELKLSEIVDKVEVDLNKVKKV
jgi:hypothetical protein